MNDPNHLTIITHYLIECRVAFNPASVRAMHILGPQVFEAFDKVATGNQWEDKKKTWFDWVDGFNDEEVGKQKQCFTISNELGANGVHRAHFLNNLVHAVPEGITHFHKHLETIIEGSDGKMKLKFHDDTTYEADAGT